MFPLLLCLLASFASPGLAAPLPVKGFQISGQFLCNGLPLIGATETLDEVHNCSSVVMHLDIPEEKETLALLEPFESWNATFQIGCGQSAILFDDAERRPTLTIIHNCPAKSASNEAQQSRKECRKWEIVVPEENIGQGEKVFDLGTRELNGLGQQVECSESAAQAEGQVGEEQKGTTARTVMNTSTEEEEEEE